MDRHIAGNSKKERNGAKAPTLGPTGQNMKVIGPTTRSRVRAFTTGLMVADSKAAGKKISCMATESTPGQTGESTKASTLTIKRKATAFTFGLTARSTKAAGQMVSSTGRVNLQMPREKAESASGLTERESVGSQPPLTKQS
jgi:hypothetical protein